MGWQANVDAIASKIPQNEVPAGLLRSKNIEDVTAEYWPVADFSTSLFGNDSSKAVFACVFNFMKWKPACGVEVQNQTVQYHNMARGVCYLPMYYANKKLIPAAFPVAIEKDGTPRVLEPDTTNRHSIALPEQDNYLIYRASKRYRLMYWNKQWTPLGAQITNGSTRSLTFTNVPQNALLLLVPEYSEHKERPFTINKLGEREWW